MSEKILTCTRFPFNLTNKVKFQSHFSSGIQVNEKVCLCRFGWQIMQFFSPIRKRGRPDLNLLLKTGKEHISTHRFPPGGTWFLSSWSDNYNV